MDCSPGTLDRTGSASTLIDLAHDVRTQHALSLAYVKAACLAEVDGAGKAARLLEQAAVHQQRVAELLAAGQAGMPTQKCFTIWLRAHCRMHERLAGEILKSRRGDDDVRCAREPRRPRTHHRPWSITHPQGGVVS